MNIFIYDLDHETNAKYHPDKQLIKMILEMAQILSTNYRHLTTYEGSDVYKTTHLNHPNTIWARETYDNFNFVVDLYYALHNEWNSRYAHDKIHKSFEIVDFIIENTSSNNFKKVGRTEFMQTMPEKYRCKNAVDAYRKYFNGDKLHLAQWKGASKPDWVDTQKLCI